jgi:hypothetical protein
MKKWICKLLGHDWHYDGPDWRDCMRCGRQEAQMIRRFGDPRKPVQFWAEVPRVDKDENWRW